MSWSLQGATLTRRCTGGNTVEQRVLILGKLYLLNNLRTCAYTGMPLATPVLTPTSRQCSLYMANEKQRDTKPIPHPDTHLLGKGSNLCYSALLEGADDC